MGGACSDGFNTATAYFLYPKGVVQLRNYLWLAVAAALALPSAAAATDWQTLDPVFVTAERDVQAGGYVYTKSRVGLLGTADVMKVPFTQVSVTEKAIQDYATPALPLQQVLVNIPAVRSSSSSPMYSDFSVRGVGMNGTHMYFNGVPSLFSQFRTAPNHMIERLDMSVGAATVLNGTQASSNGTNGGKSAAPGMVNAISKRATDAPVRSLTLNYTTKKNIGTYLDIGERMGDNKEWGARLTAGWLDGQLALDMSGKTEKTVGLNIDYRSDKSRTNLFAGHIDLRVDGAQRWFTFDGKNMPKVPSHKMAYDFPEETKYAHWWVTTLNHEQDLSDQWTAFLNTGAATWSGYKYNNNANLKFDEQGKFVDSNMVNLMNEKSVNNYVQVGVRGEFNTGDIAHKLVVAYDKSYMAYWNSSFNFKKDASRNDGKGFIGGDLYNGIQFLDGYYPLPVGTTRALSYKEYNDSLVVNDMMTIGDFDVLLGWSHRKADYKGGTNKENFKTTDNLPAYGLVYHPTEQLSIYGSYAKNISRGRQVTDSKYDNVGEVLPPVKQTIKEIGVKYDAGNWLGTVAYFSTNDGNTVDVYTRTVKEANKEGKLVDVKKYNQKQDGENEFKGFEFSVNGKVSDRLTVTGGFLKMNAERKRTKDGAKDGWYVHGVADFSAVLGLTYEATDNVDIIGRLMYNGSTKINDNGGKLPSYTTVDLGANWRTQFGAQPVEIHAMIYNLFDKSYWMGRGGSTTFGLSWPRTFVVSAKFDF